DPIQVLPMQNEVQGERKVQLPDEPRRRDLPGPAAGSRDAVGVVRITILDADLDVVEALVAKPFEGFTVEGEGRGDQGRVELRGGGSGDQIGEIAASQRFATREAEL